MLNNFDLVYFSTRVPETSNTSATQARRECDTSAMRKTSVRQECYKNDTSTTRVEILILVTTRVKTYICIPILTLWQVKNYKERNNFILKTAF